MERPRSRASPSPWGGRRSDRPSSGRRRRATRPAPLWSGRRTDRLDPARRGADAAAGPGGAQHLRGEVGDDAVVDPRPGSLTQIRRSRNLSLASCLLEYTMTMSAETSAATATWDLSDL